MEKEGPKQKSISKHALIMVLCCLIPLAILAVLLVIGVSGTYLILGLALLCPLLHLVMMWGMRKDSGNSGGHVH